MNFDFTFITNNAVVIVPIVIALVQAIKLTGYVKDHFAPLVAIAIGIAVAFLGHTPETTIATTVFGGAVYGLMASGLYAGVKTTMIAHARLKEMRAKEEKEKNH